VVMPVLVAITGAAALAVALILAADLWNNLR
jgi:hypothetical protein